jgi:hypothetical protein
MDNIRQNKWFSITVYLLSSFSILGIMLFFAEKYFPNTSWHRVSKRSDRAPRTSLDNPTLLKPSALKSALTEYTAAADRQQKLFLPLNKKTILGNAELVYRGLTGESEFQIDVIIPELDPQVSYSYRFKIADAEKSFRLVDHNLKIISIRKNALRLVQLGE